MPKTKTGPKPDKFKSLEERQAIAAKIRSELESNHINELEGIQPFLTILDDYVSQACGSSGRLFVPELDRHLEYILPVRKAANELARLVVAPHVKRAAELKANAALDNTKK